MAFSKSSENLKNRIYLWRQNRLTKKLFRTNSLPQNRIRKIKERRTVSPAPTKAKGQTPMYQLKTNCTDSFLTSSVQDQEEEKIGKNLYLKKSHFDFLDHLAEQKDVSRNQALRDILDREMGDSQ